VRERVPQITWLYKEEKPYIIKHARLKECSDKKC
jgi:hypothetical protein